MTLQIENETSFAPDFNIEEVAEKVINFCLDYVDCPYEVELNLTITDNETIHSINKEYRNIDRPTDVLSFPMVDYNAPKDFSLVEKNEEDYFNPDTGELLLGDIVISWEKVIEQAQEYGHSVFREFNFLIVHSMLHLFGYDHIEEEDRVIMEAEQKRILDEMGIYR